MGRIALRQIRALKPGEVIWDGALPGFGARRQYSEAVSYCLTYRTREGRSRWYTIGRHGAPWTPDTARAEALRLLGVVVRGGDPSAEKRARRSARTVSELCDLYLADAESGRLLTRGRAPKRASTLATDRGRVERHIKPLLGRHTVTSVTRDDIESFLYDVAVGKTAGVTKTAQKHGLAKVRGGMGTACRTLGLLGAIFSYAVRHRMRSDNPVRGVARPADGRRTRRLSDDEYMTLGVALRAADAANAWPPAVAAARLLALTGWRRGEVLGLRWSELDLVRRTATLAATKTGHSMRPLSHAACDVIRDLSKVVPRSELVFPATRGTGPMVGFSKIWARMMKLGSLPTDITPHVLRHSYASIANDRGYSEATIAALIGHQGRSMTSRYVHSADAVLLAAADAVANHILELMGDGLPDVQVVPLRA
jgi:integrase